MIGQACAHRELSRWRVHIENSVDDNRTDRKVRGRVLARFSLDFLGSN